MKKEKIDFEDVVSQIDIDNIVFKRRSNNFLLSNYQISVLKRNGINYLNYSNIKNLLFDIEQILNYDSDEELDLVSSQIAEFLYYSETKK